MPAVTKMFFDDVLWLPNQLQQSTNANMIFERPHKIRTSSTYDLFSDFAYR